MILAKPLPTVELGLQAEQPLRRSFVCEALTLVELDRVQRIGIRRIPVQEPAIGVGIVEELRIPGARLNGIGFREDVCFLRPRQRQPGQQAIVELDAAAGRLREHQDRERARRTRQEVDRVAHRQDGWRHHVQQRPARRRDVPPGAEVRGLPIPVPDRLKEVVLAALHDDDRIGAGAVGDALVLLLEVVAIVDIDWVCIGTLLGFDTWSDGEKQEKRAAGASGRRHCHRQADSARPRFRLSGSTRTVAWPRPSCTPTNSDTVHESLAAPSGRLEFHAATGRGARPRPRC